ncbi:hypothetical protein [Burkholderia latens]|uniref:hypothetical protein n=1 Tax=Burkholderia latens TaxID=488446 RepID=UPI0039A6DC6F
MPIAPLDGKQIHFSFTASRVAGHIVEDRQTKPEKSRATCIVSYFAHHNYAVQSRMIL